MGAVPVSSDQATARAQVFAAFAAAVTIIWSCRTRVTLQSAGGVPGTLAASLVPSQNLNVPSGDYLDVNGVTGLACALPSSPGVPATDTVPANYGGFGQPAMGADDFAYWYFMNAPSGNYGDINSFNV